MSFLRRDGRPWSTDKDGIIACLLAAELTAASGRDPGRTYAELTERFGAPLYRRIDAPRHARARRRPWAPLTPRPVTASELAGDAGRGHASREAPGNGAAIGGLKVVTERGWFAARPSGTEDVTKLYAESFVDEAHLDRIIEEAQAILRGPGALNRPDGRTAARGASIACVTWARTRQDRLHRLARHPQDDRRARLRRASSSAPVAPWSSPGRSCATTRWASTSRATGEAQLWVLMSQIRRELELAQQGRVPGHRPRRHGQLRLLPAGLRRSGPLRRRAAGARLVADLRPRRAPHARTWRSAPTACAPRTTASATRSRPSSMPACPASCHATGSSMQPASEVTETTTGGRSRSSSRRASASRCWPRA